MASISLFSMIFSLLSREADIPFAFSFIESSDAVSKMVLLTVQSSRIIWLLSRVSTSKAVELLMNVNNKTMLKTSIILPFIFIFFSPIFSKLMILPPLIW